MVFMGDDPPVTKSGVDIEEMGEDKTRRILELDTMK